MPSGRVHTVSTVALSLASGVTAFAYGYGEIQAVALAGGALAGVLLSPDLDVNGGSISMHHARHLGWGFGLLWAVIWTPYGYAIPHRSPLSHMPIIGTILRLGYLALIGWGLLYVTHLLGRFTLPSVPAWWPWAFAGLALSDFLHFLLDVTLRN